MNGCVCDIFRFLEGNPCAHKTNAEFDSSVRGEKEEGQEYYKPQHRIIIGGNIPIPDQPPSIHPTVPSCHLRLSIMTMA